MATTSALVGIARVGSARVGSFGEIAPATLKANGGCWQLVTDPAAIDAANRALAAQGTADEAVGAAGRAQTEAERAASAAAEAMAEARYAPRIANRPPTQADAADKPIGAGWNEYNTSGLLVQMWRWDGADWQRLDMSPQMVPVIQIGTGTAGDLVADRVTVTRDFAARIATIIELNAGRITSGTIGANLIAANSIGVGKLIVDEALAAKVVQAMSVATKNLVVTDDAILNRATIINGLAADVVAAAKVYASQLVVAALDKDGKIAPNAVGTVQIIDGAIGAAQVKAEEVAAAVGKFLALDVSQLRVTGTADLDTAVAKKIAAGTADFQSAFIQNLRTNGATIDQAVIGDLAANIITSGLFRTAKAGQRWEIDSSGIVMYGTDPDEGDIEVVRLGPAEGNNLVTLGSTTLSPSSVSTGDLSADTLSIGGDTLEDLLAPFPRGRIVQNTYTTVSNYSDRAQSRLSTNFTMRPDRRYTVTVPPFYVQGQAATGVEYKLVRAWDSLTTSWDRATVAVGRFSLPDSNPHTLPGLSADLPNGGEARDLYLTLMIAPSGSSTTPIRMVGRDDYPVAIRVDDMGLVADDTGSYWTVGNVTEATAPPPPAAPTKTRKTYTWAAANYGGDISAGDVIQGYISSGIPPMRYGGWTFPSGLISSLSGSKIEKFEVYLYASHWYASAGGTASIRPNNGSYKGTTFGATQVLSPKWPRKAGRWVTLPSSWYASIANGTYRGMSVQTDSTSTQYYGRFTGTATKFRATYVK